MDRRRHRLTSSREFAQVLRTGRRGRHGTVTVAVRRTEEPRPPRLGVATGKTVGSAVRRNRAKRLLRAVLAAALPSIPAGSDVVARFDGDVSGKSFQTVDDDARQALRQAGIAC